MTAFISHISAHERRGDSVSAAFHDEPVPVPAPIGKIVAVPDSMFEVHDPLPVDLRALQRTRRASVLVDSGRRRSRSRASRFNEHDNDDDDNDAAQLNGGAGDDDYHRSLLAGPPDDPRDLSRLRLKVTDAVLYLLTKLYLRGERRFDATTLLRYVDDLAQLTGRAQDAARWRRSVQSALGALKTNGLVDMVPSSESHSTYQLRSSEQLRETQRIKLPWLPPFAERKRARSSSSSKAPSSSVAPQRAPTSYHTAGAALNALSRRVEQLLEAPPTESEAVDSVDGFQILSVGDNQLNPTSVLFYVDFVGFVYLIFNFFGWSKVEYQRLLPVEFRDDHILYAAYYNPSKQELTDRAHKQQKVSIVMFLILKI